MVRTYSGRTNDGFEDYSEHISRCLDKFEIVFPLFYHTIIRVFEIIDDISEVKAIFRKMILYHDLGKLTRRWQQNLVARKKLPAHATLGATYLWYVLPEKMKEPISFAVSIHHTDKGLTGDNIERPDVQAIMDMIADSRGEIIWCEGIQDLNKVIPKDMKEKVNLYSMKDMARGLREWSRGCSILEQHKRRLMAMLAHHLLKLCDISAAAQRAEYTKTDALYGGWKMVSEIEEYVSNIQKRGGK